MKLADLEPRWIESQGIRIGFIFRSPADPKSWQSCFSGGTPTRKQQRKFFEALVGEDDVHLVQGCNPDARWLVQGGIVNSSFETMTVTPSLDGSAGGLWHGWIKNGEVT